MMVSDVKVKKEKKAKRSFEGRSCCSSEAKTLLALDERMKDEGLTFSDSNYWKGVVTHLELKAHVLLTLMSFQKGI